MRKVVIIFLFLILAFSLFFFYSGEFAVETSAQEPNVVPENIDNDENDAVPAQNFEDNKEEEEEAEKPEIVIPISGTESYYENVDVVDNPDDILVLANKKNVLLSDYVPKDLVKLPVFAPGRLEEVQYMREEAATAIMELYNAALEEAGLEIMPTSAYRSFKLQTTIFQNNINSKGSIAKANETSALPGQSEHQTGLAVDMSCKSVGYQVTSRFDGTEEAKWLAENAHRFGFIIRYQKGKTDITGYSYEPWHLRYVGKDAAEYIFKNELTFEEYLEE